MEKNLRTVEDAMFRWDSFITNSSTFIFPSVQPCEESQGGFCKFKRIAQSPPECLAKSKMKAGFREREQARAVLRYKVIPWFYGFFQIYVKNSVSFCIQEGCIMENIFFFQRLLKFVCTVNTGTT